MVVFRPLGGTPPKSPESWVKIHFEESQELGGFFRSLGKAAQPAPDQAGDRVDLLPTPCLIVVFLSRLNSEETTAYNLEGSLAWTCLKKNDHTGSQKEGYARAGICLLPPPLKGEKNLALEGVGPQNGSFFSGAQDVGETITRILRLT